jgi:hypothetical protein
MPDDALENLPGAEIVLPGLADLKAGRESVNASAVQAAAPRLRRAGIDAPSATGDAPAAHLLYQQLSEELGDAAHSRYNAILDRVLSFAIAAERRNRADAHGKPEPKANPSDPAVETEKVRRRRLREDARRPISVNLAETIELSHALLKMADASKRR